MTHQESLTSDDIYHAAKDLFNKKDKINIEKLFGKYLKASYDYRLWKIYLSYTKTLNLSHDKIMDVYFYILNHFEYGYDNYDFIIACIEELDKSEIADSIKNEKIRNIYQQFLKIPMNNLNKLWNQYETWEININRLSAKNIIEQQQLLYLNALNVYQKISPYLQTNAYFNIFDIELENPLKLTKKNFETRISFVFQYFLCLIPKKENIEILKTLYLPNVYNSKKDLEKLKNLSSTSLLLSFWFSFFYKIDLFNLNSNTNFTLIAINYLNFFIQNKSLKEFRDMFNHISTSFTDIKPHLYIFVAETEYMLNNPDEAYKIMVKAYEKFGDNNLLNEKFIELLIKYNDTEKIKIFFKKLVKTEKMYDMMMNYEFRKGCFNNYQTILLQKQDAIKNNELLDNVSIALSPIAFKGTQGVIQSIIKTFEYLDLTFSGTFNTKNILKKLPILPDNENIFKNIDINALIQLLTKIN